MNLQQYKKFALLLLFCVVMLGCAAKSSSPQKYTYSAANADPLENPQYWQSVPNNPLPILPEEPTKPNLIAHSYPDYPPQYNNPFLPAKGFDDDLAPYFSNLGYLLAGKRPPPLFLDQLRDTYETQGIQASLMNLLKSDFNAAARVEEFYRKYLNRGSDPEGRKHWINVMVNQGEEAAQIGFLSSPEYFSKAGSSQNGFVTKLYADLLGRTPDPSGLAGWVARLNSGTSPEQIVLGFLQSEEYRMKVVRQDAVKFTGRSLSPAAEDFWNYVFENSGVNSNYARLILAGSRYAIEYLK